MNSICRQTVYRLPCAACEDAPPSGGEKTGKKAGVPKCRKPNGRQCKYGKNMISADGERQIPGSAGG